jgi:hypothetical protein
MRLGNVVRKRLRGGLLVFLAIFVVCMSFAIYTNNTWEDFYITYRASKNLATGNGLVYTVGQRVQSFTSPLNTLIPAGLIVITGDHSDALVLWLFRIISASALAGAAAIFYRIGKSLGLRPFAIFFLIALIATDTKIIAYSINGQECGIMIFFLALILHALLVPPSPYYAKTIWRVPQSNVIRLGLGWTGLLWTRPDACVYITLIALGFLIFNAGYSEKPSRQRLLKIYLLAGVIAFVLYLPWVLWAWSYFGSPIPNTIVAKGLGWSLRPGAVLDRTLAFLINAACADVPNIFAPIYYQQGGWTPSTAEFAGRLAWVGFWYWLLPFASRPARAVSLTFFLAAWYYNAITPSGGFPWYFPSAAILGLFVLGLAVHDFAGFLDLLKIRALEEPVFRRVQTSAAIVALAIPAFCALILIASAFELRIQQREIEEGNRKTIGLWLRDHAKSQQDTVFLEPLGYIGYYSQLKMLDYPGLSSPEVVAARRAHLNDPNPNNWLSLIKDLHPDWLVLRYSEALDLQNQAKDIFNVDYEIVKLVSAADQLSKYPPIPGAGYLQFDQTFVIVKKKAAP